MNSTITKTSSVTPSNIDTQLAGELLRHRQLDLEELSIEMGVRRYRKEVQEWSLTESAMPNTASTIPGRYLLAANVQKLSAAIEGWRDDVTGGKARRQALLVHIMGELEPDAMALIALSKIVDCMGTELALQRCASLIVQPILDEINYRRFKSGAPGYEYVTRDAFKTDTSQRHRSLMLKNCITQAQIVQFGIDPKEKQALANLLIDLTIQSTGICQLGYKNVAKHRKLIIIQPAEHIVDWLDSMHAQCSVLAPVMLPMLVPPKPWTGVFSGGYLSDKLSRAMVKSRNDNYLSELDNVDMPIVYGAINNVQAVAWRVNKRVLEVMRAVWESASTLGGLPPRDQLPMPAKPRDIETNPEARKEWCGRAFQAHRANSKLMSKRIAISQKLWMADKFADEAAIYYPHQLDWRSRIYPMAGVGSMNPQGDDTGKALIEFATGVPVGESGGYWIAVHLANLFGIDKIPIDERVQWVIDNEMALRMCAIDPLEYQMWTDADKPYCALAAIFEWDAYRRTGDTFVSHLPIAKDGSNNGAQHLSAMGRDAIATVNLIPADKPQDIYNDVALAVRATLAKMTTDGDEKAQFWNGHITRSLAKRPVMTLCYGATRMGMSNQLHTEVEKSAPELFYNRTPKETKELCTWLAGIMYAEVSNTLVSASLIMGWLRESSRITSSNDLPIKWVTPAGFPVMQSYTKDTSEMLASIIAGVRVRLHLSESTKEINRYKQAAGISPNFVHSLDASHLMLSINSMVLNGIPSIAMIHDSYACHAAHVDTMDYIIREQFVKMYSDDLLQGFANQLSAQLPEELAQKIQPIPAKGSLDLALVMDSEFFFA